MSGPDPGDSADEGGDEAHPDRPHDPPSDGTGTPDDHGDESPEIQSTDDSRRLNDSTRAAETRGESARDATTRGDAGDRRPIGPGDDSSARNESGVTIEDDGVARWFLETNDESVVLVRDVLSSVAIVAIIGLVLFGVSGIWPPLVAVESGSMEPNMERGDLVFVVDDDRFVGDGPADGTGVVPRDSAQESGHEKFGKAGDVIVFRPNGDARQTPVIHRAHFWVEEGENWVDTRANEEYVGGATCDQIQTCPAEYDGFITKGDANSGYDQHYASGARTDVVKPEWITGKAMFRIPYLGHVRLTFDAILGEAVAPSPATPGTTTQPFGPAQPGLQAGLAGATGVAATGTGVAVAIARSRE